MLAFVNTRHAQPVDYAKAMAFIEDHGDRVFVTKEGLLVMAATYVPTDYHADLVAECDDDIAIEHPAVFPIDDMGRVDGRAVRDWLGY